MSGIKRGFLLSDYFLKRPTASGFIVFILLMCTSGYITLLSYRITKKNEQRDLHNMMQVIQHNIEQLIDQGSLAALTMALTIRDGVPENFDAVAAELINSYTNLDAIQMNPGGVIKYVYPYEENKSVIGYDILADTNRNKEAFKAIAFRKMFYAGPLELRQGGTAIVGRLPIFIDHKFWGFSAVIIKLHTLLESAGISDSGKNSGYYFQLSKLNPGTKKQEFFLPVRDDLNIEDGEFVYFPAGAWKLHVVPDLKQKSNYGTLALAGFGTLLSIISGLFVRRILKKPAALHELIETQSAELLKSDQRNKAILQALPDMLFVLDEEGTFLDHHNSQHMDTLYPPDFFLGKKVSEVMPPGLAEEILENIKQVFKTGNFRLHNYHLELQSDTNYFEARYALNSKTEVLVVIRDITKQKKIEAELLQKNKELQTLSDHLQTIREDERASLSRELHDELGQQLTAITLDLFWLRKMTPETKEKGRSNVLGKINDAITVVQQASASVKRINTELRPSILDDLGLFAAIEWQVNDFAERHDIKTTLDFECEEPRINASKAIAIFRILQESLNNIAKHAKSSSVKVRVFEKEGELKMNITDDGIGFDNLAVKKNISFGLLGMKERANMLNGNVEINSVPGTGTSVELRLPLDQLKQDNGAVV